MFYADLHIHSKYSRACSRDCDLEHLAWWARRKGVALVGTGDFTHPAWMEQLRAKLISAEPGLFRLDPKLDRDVVRTLPATCQGDVRFMLSVEISTIYKRGERTRKVHHLIYVPDFGAAERVTKSLARIGNLASDGRPILGLDSRDLLEITLESDPASYLVPAHAWTPWFSVLGSKSGFDAVADCYADLAHHVFAIETGLSSDPSMNWMVSALDRYTLVSNSDAHSPPMLGREASVFDVELDYHTIQQALRTRQGYLGTVEFFPEEGKYHLDGHRKCEVRLEPQETRSHGGRCPKCDKPVTVGVLHRVAELADRAAAVRPNDHPGYTCLVPLPEIVGEIRGVGARSKKVAGEIADLVARLGPELTLLTQTPIEEIEKAADSLLAEGIRRLRRREVIRDAGYDGEYGVIRLFDPDELRRPASVAALFELSSAEPVFPTAKTAMGKPVEAPPMPAQQVPRSVPVPVPTGTVLDGLDPQQRAAAEVPDGPLLIVAGPGTGKTRTLTHRIAHLVKERAVPPEQCLAITFTRRARAELEARLTQLMGDQAIGITVTTFHGLGVRVLREVCNRVGLSADFRVADETARAEVAADLAGSPLEGRRLLAKLPEDAELAETFAKAMRERDLVGFDDLVRLPLRLFSEDADLTKRYRKRWQWVSVDEYQDVDSDQHALLRQLVPADGNLTVIGDPDQAIYSFRGSCVTHFLAFDHDFPGGTTVHLTRNYRSSAAIVSAGLQAVAQASLVPGRALHAVQETDSAKVTLYEAADPEAEAAFVVRSIEALLGGSSFHALDSGVVDTRSVAAHGLSLADVAVLYRTDAQAGPIMAALDRAGLPYQKRTHDRLVNRPGVREVAAELVHHPVGPLPDRLRAAGRHLVDRLGERHEANIRSAVELLLPLARRCGEDLPAFLTELSLGVEVDTLDPRADAVALLTLHAAKGLEYDAVFCVGCEDTLLPLWLPGQTGRDAAEERRLFFVGITRARRYLHLSYACRRTRHGADLRTGPSPFLASISADLLERVTPNGPPRRRDRQLRLL